MCLSVILIFSIFACMLEFIFVNTFDADTLWKIVLNDVSNPKLHPWLKSWLISDRF